MEPLPMALGNYKYAIVAIEYFSKWIEAKAVQTITSQVILKFFWQNVVCRFGVPYELTVDNGKQFDSTDFMKILLSLGNKAMFRFSVSPVVKRSSGKGQWHNLHRHQKNITGMPRGKWAEELPRVIWSHNTTESRTTKFTPFRLLYGEEAMVPEEVKLGSMRTKKPPKSDDMNLAINTREETKMQALKNIETYLDETRRWKNKKVFKTTITTGDMVLRKKTKGVAKLQEKWDDPFLVDETRIGAYRLKMLEGEEVSYSWNKDMLQKYWV